MLLTCLLRWGPPITTSFLFLVLFLQSLLRIPQKRRCLWRFTSARWGDLRRYKADFHWNYYCFRVRITEVIVSGMEAVDSVWHGGVHSSFFFSS
ncbi:hypothetical protein E2C01_031942 [Portunus trituberculatus]|uniref:Uncharacterized protein n=1 Tax=Portunus trituberculatus TaxID=210409 RepID=A0A5B7EYC0_PORTR|nr:hypothetical protein [Portunus trituberculatus]